MVDWAALLLRPAMSWLENLKKSVETEESLVNWLAEMWRTRNWVRAILLVDALILALLNRIALDFALNQIGRGPVAWWYPMPPRSYTCSPNSSVLKQ